MTVYMTKTWGFSSPSGPLQFSLQGWRNRARSLLRPGDLVVIVGTMGDETAPDERGKILGLMEPTTTVVSSLDFDLARGPRDFDEHGNYRWPFGLELHRAWRFTEPRHVLSRFSKRRFSMDSAQGIVPLLPDEAEAILHLPHDPVSLRRPIRATARIEGSEAARRKAAPPPTTTRNGVMHMRRAPAFNLCNGDRGSHDVRFQDWLGIRLETTRKAVQSGGDATDRRRSLSNHPARIMGHRDRSVSHGASSSPQLRRPASRREYRDRLDGFRPAPAGVDRPPHADPPQWLASSWLNRAAAKRSTACRNPLPPVKAISVLGRRADTLPKPSLVSISQPVHGETSFRGTIGVCRLCAPFNPRSNARCPGQCFESGWLRDGVCRKGIGRPKRQARIEGCAPNYPKRRYVGRMEA